jgi:hypothetical protein
MASPCCKRKEATKVIGVKQDHHVFVLNQTRLAFRSPSRQPAHGAWFASSNRGGDHFTAHRALHVGDFFWPLVDQQNDQNDRVGMVAGNGVRDVLQVRPFCQDLAWRVTLRRWLLADGAYRSRGR